MTTFDASYIAPRVVQPAPGPDDVVPTITRRHDVHRYYADAPGALRATEAALELDMLKVLDPLYGREQATKALGRIKWTHTPPSWAGGPALLSAEVTIVSLVKVIHPDPEPMTMEEAQAHPGYPAARARAMAAAGLDNN